MRMNFPSFDKETIYMLVCLETILFPGRPMPAVPANLDWERLFQVLDHHHLAAYFYTLSKTFGFAWPDQFSQKLRGTNYKVLLHNTPRQDLVKQVLSYLRENNIDVIVLKGWANIQTIYSGDISARFCIDIDILVRPTESKHAAKLLNELGYEMSLESWPGYSEKYSNAHVYLSPLENLPLQIGFHWGLFHRPYYDPNLVDMDKLFTRAIPLEVAGVNVLELSYEDQIVYSCAHLGLHHNYDDVFYRYFEIGSLIQRGGENLNWNAVINQAILWHCIIPVRRVLDSLNLLWTDIAPENILAKLNNISPVFMERFVNWWISATGGRPSFDHLLTWITIPGFQRRFEIAFKDIFPSRAYMEKRYGRGSSKFWPFYYFRRLLRSFHFIGKSQHPDK